MSTVGVTGNIAFGASPGVLPAQRKHISAMTTPVCTEVGDWFETVGYAMIDLFPVVVL